MISEQLVQIKEYRGKGYAPVVDFCTWRVAILNYDDELLPENITNMQRHDETDEIFVLLSGDCILFIGNGNETAGSISAIKMQPEKIYNIRKGVWHNHTLSVDAKVLIVENSDTEDGVNSPFIDLNKEQMDTITGESRKLMV